MRIKMETKELMADMRHELNIALVDAAKQIIEISKKSAPTKTGELRDSIKIVEKGANYVELRSTLAYAARVHWQKSLKLRKGKSRWLFNAMRGAAGKRILKQCVIKQLGG